MVPFAFEDRLVRVVERDGDPWFVGRDVCDSLEVRNASDALATLDDDEKGIVSADTPGGRQELTIISEPGVYRLVFRSRKPAAERFKRWLAHEVLPALRKKGSYGQAPADGAAPPPPTMMPTTYLEALSTVRELRMISGPAVAREAWRRLGLPAIPIEVTTAVGEARACLRHLLEASLGRCSVGEALEEALEGDEAYRILLRDMGLKPVREGDQTGFLVANKGKGLERIYATTRWDGGGWRRVLRRLPGAEAGRGRFDDGQERATFVPEAYLDPATEAPMLPVH